MLQDGCLTSNHNPLRALLKSKETQSYGTIPKQMKNWKFISAKDGQRYLRNATLKKKSGVD